MLASNDVTVGVLRGFRTAFDAIDGAAFEVVQRRFVNRGVVQTAPADRI